jgi:serine/threonine protein kinase
MKPTLSPGQSMGRTGYIVDGFISSGGFSELYRVYRPLGKAASGEVRKLFHAFKLYLTHEEVAARGNRSQNVYEISRLSPEEQTNNELEIMLTLDHPNIMKPHDTVMNFDSAGHSGIVMEHMGSVSTLQELSTLLNLNGYRPFGCIENARFYWELQERHPQMFTDFRFSGGGDFAEFLQFFEKMFSEPRYALMVEQEARGYVLRQLGNIIKQGVAASQFVHNRRIVHNDIKLDNLLWDSCQAVKLIDFGISYHEDNKNHMWGNTRNSPPERYIGMQNPDVDL